MTVDVEQGKVDERRKMREEVKLIKNRDFALYLSNFCVQMLSLFLQSIITYVQQALVWFGSPTQTEHVLSISKSLSIFNLLFDFLFVSP